MEERLAKHRQAAQQWELKRQDGSVDVDVILKSSKSMELSMSYPKLYTIDYFKKCIMSKAEAL